MSQQTVCLMDDLPEYGCLELDLNGDRYFAVRQGSDVYIYRNRCPHIGLPLNLLPHQFLDYDKRHIQCTSHGAMFDIKTGLCVAGPCQKQSLESIPCKVEQGSVLLLDNNRD